MLYYIVYTIIHTSIYLIKKINIVHYLLYYLCIYGDHLNIKILSFVNMSDCLGEINFFKLFCDT